MSAGLTDSEMRCIRDLVCHRFLRFQPGMNLILKSAPQDRGSFKAVADVASCARDKDVPCDHLNSIAHLDDIDFVPDLAHEPTLNMALQSFMSGFKFDYHECPVWNEAGWRLVAADEQSALTGVYPSKASALIWAMCITPPF